MADDNGAAPPPADPEPATAKVSPADMAMGLFGLAVAIGIALIALDLITGGGLARLVPTRSSDDGG